MRGDRGVWCRLVAATASNTHERGELADPASPGTPDSTGGPGRTTKLAPHSEMARSKLPEGSGMGAVPWAERAEAELRAGGETARKRDLSTAEQLTRRNCRSSGWSPGG